MPESVPLQSIHHVEFVVGNAKQAAYFYRKAFGFSQVAYLGPETGYRDRASYALQQGDIRLVMTTPLTPEHPLSEHHRLHGDGVRDIAFLVDDVDSVYHEVIQRGALEGIEPRSQRPHRQRQPRRAIAKVGPNLAAVMFIDGAHRLRRLLDEPTHLLGAA